MEEDFWSHLDDLRKRILFSLIFFFVGSSLIYPFSEHIIRYFVSYVGRTYFFAPQEALFIRIKLSLMGGFVVSLPFIVHQMYLFIVPALTSSERRYASPLLIALIIFFYGGVAVAFYIFLPYILKMLLSFQMDVLSPLISISRFLGFMLWILGGFGFAFEMPVFFFLLTKLGVLSPSLLYRKWRISVVAILLFASIITPTLDMVTMLIASVPLFFLYFISIGSSYLAMIGRKKQAV